MSKGENMVERWSPAIIRRYMTRLISQAETQFESWVRENNRTASQHALRTILSQPNDEGEGK